VSALASVLKAQHQLRAAIRLLQQARDAEPTHLIRTELATTAHDLARVERSLDAVTFALRGISDPTRGVR
jgi:hypothetical protein